MAGAPETMLRTFLADHDQPCPACGYNLRGITTARCPECGWPLRLTSSPPWGPCLVALFGLATGAAPWLFVPPVVLSNPRPWMWAMVWLAAVPPLLNAAAFIALARARGRLWMSRASPARRATVSIACWCASPVTGALYVLILSLSS